MLLEFDFDYLFLWGHYRLMTELHERLQGKITDPRLAEVSAGNLGSAYSAMGQVQRAIELLRARLCDWHGSTTTGAGEGAWLANLATCISDLGQNARAIEYVEQAWRSSREVGDRSGEASPYVTSELPLLGNRSECPEPSSTTRRLCVIDREIENTAR